MKQKYFLRGLSIGLLFAIVLLVVMDVMNGKEAERGVNTAQTGIESSAHPQTTVDAQLTATTQPDENVSEQPTEAVAAGTTAPDQVNATNAPGVSVTVVPGTNGNAGQSTDTKEITFEITAGMTAVDVCEKLESQGVINNAEEFNSYMKNRGYADNIQVGTHKIPANATYEQIANAISDNKK